MLGTRDHRRNRPRWGRIAGALALFAAIVAGSVVGIPLLLNTTGGQEPPAVTPSGDAATPTAPEQTPTAAPTQSPPPTASPTPAPLGKVTVHMRAVGDLMCHENNYMSAKTEDGYDFTPFFEAIKPSLASADLTIGNFETTVGPEPYSGYPAFRSPESYLDALRDAGFDVLGFANNHTLDKGASGVELTLAAMAQRGLDSTGAYASREASEELLIKDVNGVKIAILAYTVHSNVAVGTDSHTLNFLNESSADTVKADAAAARELGADIVAVMMHWGTEYARDVNDNQRTWAKRLGQAGVDIVLGAHAHVVQPAEWIETELEGGGTHRTFVAYGMGNFISNQQEVYQDAGTIFDIGIEKDLDTGACAIISVGYVPTYVLRTGAAGAYDYAVLPAGAYREMDYPGLEGSKRDRVQAVWSQTVEMMEGSGADSLTE